jgi:hypothetical protein
LNIILILSSHLYRRLPGGLLPSDFLTQSLCTFRAYLILPT